MRAYGTFSADTISLVISIRDRSIVSPCIFKRLIFHDYKTMLTRYGNVQN